MKKRQSSHYMSLHTRTNIGTTIGEKFKSSQTQPHMHVHFLSGQSVHLWPGRPGLSPKSSHTKDLKNGT